MMKKLDEKLTKVAILKRTYKLLELEYTQGVKISVSDLAKRNGIKPGTLQTRAKRDGWRKKREEYLENLACAKTGHLTGEAFSDLLRKTVTDLSNRLVKVLAKEASDLESGAPDTVDAISSRLRVVKLTAEVGMMAFGKVTPATAIREPIFEVVVSPIEVGYKEVTEVVESAELTVELPPGMTIEEVTGQDDDFE